MKQSNRSNSILDGLKLITFVRRALRIDLLFSRDEASIIRNLSSYLETGSQAVTAVSWANGGPPNLQSKVKKCKQSDDEDNDMNLKVVGGNIY